MPNAYQVPGTQGTITISLAPSGTGLATSSGLVAGRASAAVTSGNWADAVVSGTIMLGTTPTSSTEIRVYVYAQRNDTPTYPAYGTGGSISGADEAITFSSAAVRDSALFLAQVIGVDATTSNNPMTVKGFSLFQVCGFVPKKWGLFVTHSTVAALNGTGSNHEFVYMPYTWGSA